jgi:hypothetical protein
MRYIAVLKNFLMVDWDFVENSAFPAKRFKFKVNSKFTYYLSMMSVNNLLCHIFLPRVYLGSNYLGILSQPTMFLSHNFLGSCKTVAWVGIYRYVRNTCVTSRHLVTEIMKLKPIVELTSTDPDYHHNPFNYHICLCKQYSDSKINYRLGNDNPSKTT